MRSALAVALLLLAASARAADSYSLREEGDFSPAGYRVEFYDRYGWKSYRVDFDFGVDPGARTLTRGSKLKLTVERLDGRKWSYACKAKGGDDLTANVNLLYGKGVSVAASCPIPAKKFAKAVDLDAEDVGAPMLVFEAVVQDGQASAGAQRGLYFLNVPQGSDLAGYASPADAVSLAVVFHSSN